MWKCNKCGNEVVEIETNKYFLNKDKNRELYSYEYIYQCPNCGNCSDSDIEDIADWKKE